VPSGHPAHALVQRLPPLEEAVGEPVDDRRPLRSGPAREQPQEILELRGEVEGAARPGDEERPGAELVDRQEPAAGALIPQGDRERPPETAERRDAVARERGGEVVLLQEAACQRAAYGAVGGGAPDAQPARVAGRIGAFEAG
jgi:hypothetical protein